MKTAISIPDPVFEAAEKLAQQLGVSRSQLYTTAVIRYLDAFDHDAIIRALNEVYAEPSEGIDPLLWQMQVNSLPADEW